VPLGQVVNYLSLGNHFDSLTTGLFRLSDLIYFLCLIVFWLAASNHSVESARWG